ncbi:MAG: hypothetical protein IT379_00245 [Deltaproteobacteria bacterium]|nr:hypothetical protein [Deltaproteobacteria bacterium]
MAGPDETDSDASAAGAPDAHDEPAAARAVPDAPTTDAPVEPDDAPALEPTEKPVAPVRAEPKLELEERPLPRGVAPAPPPPPETTPYPAALLESLLLRDSAARSARLAGDVRAKLRSDLALVTQRRDAAEILARHGHPAEAFALARESFLGARRIAQKLLSLQAPGVAFPGALGFTASSARTVDAAAKLAERNTPERDDAFSPDDERALSSLLEIAPTLERRLDRLTAPSRDLWLLRIRRLVVLALATVAFVAAVLYVTAPKRELMASASAWWGSSDDEHPRNAVDGDESTEWHLPDAALGFLEVRPMPARDIRAVRLLDTRNPPFFDRVTTRVRVTAFAGDRQLATRESEMPASIGAGRWVEIPMVARGVDRVRIDILAFSQKGGGLTEVALVDL